MIGLLENMTDYISSQIGSDKQDVDLVQDIGGSLLQGMSNTLGVSAPRASSEDENTEEKEAGAFDEENNERTNRKQVKI